MTDERERSDRLVERLEDGFAKIGEALSHGIEVTNWERHWLELLKQYESIEDTLAEEAQQRAPVQVGMAGMPRGEAA